MLVKALLAIKETATIVTVTIVNHIGDHFLNELKEQMTIYLFSIMLSGSNDTGLQKILNADSYIRC